MEGSRPSVCGVSWAGCIGEEKCPSGSGWEQKMPAVAPAGGSRRDTIHKEGGAGGCGPDRGCSLLCLERVSLLGREGCRVTGYYGHTGPHID